MYIPNFNSHAHVERDSEMFSYFANKFGISTHTLTWSVTNITKIVLMKLIISTHTLTWSVTFYFGTQFSKNGNFNSHAHVERDSA